VVRNAAHTTDAKRLCDYLSNDTVVTRLIAGSALEGKSAESPQYLPADWKMLLDDLEPATEILRRIFLR
jgi:hypothetical protein